MHTIQKQLQFINYIANKANNLDITSKCSINTYLNNFWEEIIIKPSLPNNAKIAIQLRVRFTDGSQASFTQIYIVTISDRDWLVNVFNNILLLKEEKYSSKNINTVVFHYALILDDLFNSFPTNYGNEKGLKKFANLLNVTFFKMKTIINNFLIKSIDFVYHFSFFKLDISKFIIALFFIVTPIILILFAVNFGTYFFRIENIMYFFRIENIMYFIGCVSFGFINIHLTDKFKYSKNRFIGFLQYCLVCFITIMTLSLVFVFFNLYCFGYEIYCAGDDSLNNVSDSNNSSISSSSTNTTNSNTDNSNTVNSNTANSNNDNGSISVSRSNSSTNINVSDSAVSTIGNIISNINLGELGRMSASGAVGASVVKYSTGPIGVRALAGIATTLTTNLGLNVTNQMAENIISVNRLNININGNTINNSNTSGSTNSVNNNINKPDVPNDDGGFINSVLEYGDLISPIEKLLFNQFELSLVILIFIFNIIFILLNLHFVQNDSNKLRLFSLVDRVFSTRLSSFFKNLVGKLNRYSKMTMYFILIFNFMMLLFLVLVNMYVSFHLCSNFDSYNDIYNEIHNNIDKSIFIIGSFTYKTRSLVLKINSLKVIQLYLLDTIKKIVKFFEKTIVSYRKFIIIFIIFNLIILLLNLTFNIYITYELINNLDDFLTVFNYISGKIEKSLILFGFLKTTNLICKYYSYKKNINT